MGCGDSKPQPPSSLRVDAGQGSLSASNKMEFKGKSSLVLRFTKDSFSENMTSTIGAAFASRDVTLDDKSLVKLQIWDTAGEEMYRSMTRSFFRDASAGIIVYDVTNPTSYEHTKLANAQSWLKDFRDQCPDAVAVLVGNKADKEGQRRVTTNEASEYAAGLGLEFYEASAKSGQGVADIFLHLAKTLAMRKKNRQM